MLDGALVGVGATVGEGDDAPAGRQSGAAEAVLHSHVGPEDVDAEHTFVRLLGTKHSMLGEQAEEHATNKELVPNCFAATAPFSRLHFSYAASLTAQVV